MIHPSTQIRNPLDGMASVLAIRDLRSRVRDSLAGKPVDDKRILRLMALDPLAALRCLRVAHAPINGHENELLSLPTLYRALGRPIVLRAMRARVHEPIGTTDIRRLWLHALATAHAARALAEASGDFDPDTAYLLGLLHDLPLWLHYLGQPIASDGEPDPQRKNWLECWDLPPTLRHVLDRPATQKQSTTERESGDPSALIAAAELLAELADFWHPDDGDTESRNLLLSLVTKEDLVAAHNLRQDVAHALEEFGLTLTLGENADLSVERSSPTELFPSKSKGDIAEVVLTLLSCRGTQHYREILTAATSACLRYLDFERVYYLQWNRDLGQVVVRAKADLSPRRLTKAKIQLTESELHLFETVHGENQPHVIIRLPGEPDGLMQILGSTEALVAPLNREFGVPSFLVMDRALSGMPIELNEDGRLAQGLAGAVSMLTENLILKKLRDRAEKYALTDPLTRLFNRTVGISSLAQANAQARRTGAPLTVLMIDIDDFKQLNDTRGHVVGDMALRQTADVMRRTLRRADVLCRYGGEEFLVVLPDTSTEEATVSAARLFTAVSDAGEALGLPLTISIGLAEAQDGDDVESLLARADGALYASKSRGRNRFSVDVS